MDDKETIRQALAATKMATSIVGPLDWTAPVADNTAKPFPNVVTTPLVGGQWVTREEPLLRPSDLQQRDGTGDRHPGERTSASLFREIASTKDEVAQWRDIRYSQTP